MPPKKEKKGVFSQTIENIKDIRSRLFENILISAIVHFVFAFMVVLAIFNILAAVLFINECPANPNLPTFVLLIGVLALADVLFAIIAIAPFGFAFVFHYFAFLLRSGNFAVCVLTIIEVSGLSSDPDRFLFCEPTFLTIGLYNSCIYISLFCCYYLVLFMNIITAIIMACAI